MKLYSAGLSPNGKRVRICAHELGITLEQVVLDYTKGEQRAPEYRAMNPMGKWPTLADDDFTLFESAAILWYLATTRGAQSLLPKEPRAEADVLRWLFFCSCHFDPYFTTLVVERFIKARQGKPEDEAQVAAAVGYLARFVAIVEQQLATRAYVTGSFGLADIALGCTLELSPLVRYDLAPFPNVRAWLERVQSRESWRAATAS
jgi:glutathione S-transferase